jgi:Cu(I)/Ag(I) efflux system membrane fusion protein
MKKLSPFAQDWQVHTVLKKYWPVPVFVFILAGLFLTGSWYGQSKATGQRAAGSRRILCYVDPMNPSHTSPEPGLAPCGMKMEPVYADDEGQKPNSPLSPGSIKVTPEKQQIIGVRVATTEKSPYTYTLRTVGKVLADETRTYRVNAFSDGFITKVYNVSTGSLVRRDEPLAAFYSKDLFTALQTYYYAIYALDNLQIGQPIPASQRNLLEAQKRAAEYSLMNLGVSSQQIKDLIRSKEITQEIIINAPATSFVLSRKVTPGQKFVTGEELFQLADLSRVWIVADLYENEAKYVRPGEQVRVTFPNQDDTRQATVSEVLPEFDPATLTVKVRLEMDNPGFTLRPGMFVDVEFPIQKPPTVNVPVDAIMDSGLKQMVFVDRGNGFFEPRRVKIGWRLGDRVEIAEGLKPGERIVVSGNFLIDSESRMKLAAAGFYGNVVKDPVCGMNLDEGKAKSAGLKSDYQGKAYYFCSDECQKKFDATPARYGTRPEAGPVPERVASSPKAPVAPEMVPEMTQDPVCGMNLEQSKAKSAGLKIDYRGKTYYFCSDECQKKFEESPEPYLAKTPGGAVHGAASPHGAHLAAGRVKDPACGLEVAMEAAQKAGRTSEYQGKMYYFDTDGCKQRFDIDPQHYLSGSSEASVTHPFPLVPTNPDLLLRLRRDSIRAIPAGKGQALVEDPAQKSQVKPASPSGPMPPMPNSAAPMQPAGPTAPMVQGAAPAAPAGPAQPMANPGPTPGVPHAMPHGGAQVMPPAATPAAPQGPAAVKSPESTPAAPQAQLVPPSPTQPASPTCPPGREGPQHD